jgi:hypothetical protein
VALSSELHMPLGGTAARWAFLNHISDVVFEIWIGGKKSEINFDFFKNLKLQKWKEKTTKFSKLEKILRSERYLSRPMVEVFCTKKNSELLTHRGVRGLDRTSFSVFASHSHISEPIFKKIRKLK